MLPDSTETLHSFLSVTGWDLPEWMASIRMPRKPFEHQREDIKFFCEHDRFGLFSQPGVGKTLPMQAFGVLLVTYGNGVIYIMPPILINQFKASFESNYPKIGDFVRIEALVGNPKERDALLENWGNFDYPDIVLMSYKMFVKYWEHFKERGFSMLFVDEATVVKTHTSQIHKAVKSFVEPTNGLGLVTGTPIESNVEDCFGLIKLIRPEAYGSKANFDYLHVIKDSYFNPTNHTTISKVVGYKNHDLLHRQLYAQGRRVLKSEVSDLPPRLFSEYLVALSPSHRALYDKMVEERMLEIRDELIDLTTAQSLYQAMQRVLLSPESFGEEIKDNTILDMLDAILESLDGRKVIVFAWFNKSVETIVKRYPHLSPVVINGQVTGKARDLAKQTFIEDANCGLMVMNPKSGGVGVDLLQHVCSDMVFAEPCALPGVFDQALGRLHRTGQRAETINVYLITAVKTVAVRLRNKLILRDKQQEDVVRDRRTVLQDLVGAYGLKGSFDDID
jgi:SNF2 family DNA or RNA helicase